MRPTEARRQLEKIQTLTEDLIENFPEEPNQGLVDSYRQLEEAAEAIANAIGFISHTEGGEDEPEEHN